MVEQLTNMQESLGIFLLFSTCYQKVYTKFTLLLAVLFEKSYLHRNLQFFPWIWNAFSGSFSEEGQEEMAVKSRVYQAGSLRVLRPTVFVT